MNCISGIVKADDLQVKQITGGKSSDASKYTQVRQQENTIHARISCEEP